MIDFSIPASLGTPKRRYVSTFPHFEWGYRTSKSGQGMPNWYCSRDIGVIHLSFPINFVKPGLGMVCLDCGKGGHYLPLLFFALLEVDI